MERRARKDSSLQRLSASQPEREVPQVPVLVALGMAGGASNAAPRSQVEHCLPRVGAPFGAERQRAAVCKGKLRRLSRLDDVVSGRVERYRDWLDRHFYEGKPFRRESW